MTANEKLRIALKCLRSISKYGMNLPSDGLAKEALFDMGESEVEPESKVTIRSTFGPCYYCNDSATIRYYEVNPKGKEIPHIMVCVTHDKRFRREVKANRARLSKSSSRHVRK